MQITEDKIAEIKRAADIHDVVSEYVALKKAGKDYVGLCPFHDEKTASFSVSTDKQMYFCFGCGTAGDVFEFLMKKNGLSFLEAAKQLAARYGLEISEGSAPVTHHGTPKPPGRVRGQRSEVRGREKSEVRDRRSEVEDQESEIGSQPPELWREKAGKLVGWAHEKLLANPEQLKILAARGIKIETVKHFRLGWIPGKDGKDLFRPRECWGLPTEIKNDHKKKLWLPIGLIIPMFSGNCVHRLRIRRPDGSKPIYYIIPGSSMATWVIQRSKRVFIIVESELDGILLWQEARDVTGIIPLGSSSTRPDLVAIKLLQKSSWILNALDFDQAGANASSWWINHFSQHYRWPVPAGKDPGEAFQAGIDLRQWITSGFPSGWQTGVGRFSSNSEKKQQTSQKEVKNSISGKEDVPNQTQAGGDKGQPQGHSGSQPIGSQPTPPDALQKLEKLLKQYPVTIYNSAQQISMKESPAWAGKNPEASKEISNLVFMIPEVLAYICKHPIRIITGDNLILKEIDG